MPESEEDRIGREHGALIRAALSLPKAPGLVEAIERAHTTAAETTADEPAHVPEPASEDPEPSGGAALAQALFATRPPAS